MTDLQLLQDILDLQDDVNGLITGLVIVAIVAGVWLIVLSLHLSEISDFAVIKDLKKRDGELTERIYALETETTGPLTGRLQALEKRLKAFEALERIGMAAQLSEEMLARTDAEITAMEQETIEKMTQMRAQHDQTLAHLKHEMERFRDELSQVAGAGTTAR